MLLLQSSSLPLLLLALSPDCGGAEDRLVAGEPRQQFDPRARLHRRLFLPAAAAREGGGLALQETLSPPNFNILVLLIAFIVIVLTLFTFFHWIYQLSSSLPQNK